LLRPLELSGEKQLGSESRRRIGSKCISYLVRKPMSFRHSTGMEARWFANWRDRAPGVFKGIWPTLIELWMLAILVAFFMIRVVNSSLGQEILGKLTSGHLR
jgi:hypothetical protein